MTHPHQLHAQAACWSLRAARQHLDIQVAIAHRERGLALVEAADGLRSQIYGNRYGLGRYGDPTAGAALDGTTAARSSCTLTVRVEQLAASVTATLDWLATQLGVAGDGDPLERLAAVAPNLRPSTAEQLALWIVDEDRRLRRALGLPLEEYATAEQLATRLTTDARPITADRIRDWARRSRRRGDRLYGLLPSVHTPGERTGNAWYRVADARRVATLTGRKKPQVTDEVDDQAA